MIGLFDKIDPEVAQEQRSLLRRIHQDHQKDGIIVCYLPKVVIGRKKTIP